VVWDDKGGYRARGEDFFMLITMKAIKIPITLRNMGLGAVNYFVFKEKIQLADRIVTILSR
jgi:hypothetical protein